MEEKEVRNHYKLGSKPTPPLKRAVARSPKNRPSVRAAAVIIAFIILGGIFTTYSFDTTTPSAKPPAKKELEKPSEKPPQWDAVLTETEEEEYLMPEHDESSPKRTVDEILHNNWRKPTAKLDQPPGKPALLPQSSLSPKNDRSPVPKEPIEPRDSKGEKPQPQVPTEPPSTPVADPFTIAVWFPFWDEQQALHSLNKNADTITEVNFFWYDAQEDGSITLRPSMTGENKTALEIARKNKMKVIPVIGNGFNPDRLHKLLATKEQRTKLAEKITELVTVKMYDGIEINFEPIDSQDRDAFSLFIEELATKLHAEEKLLAVSVYPKTAEPGEYQGQMAQDWNQLGKTVDIFKIKAYNYSWAHPGPNAPLDWIDQILSFGKEQVSADKIQLGLPLYGYNWTSSHQQYPFFYSQAQEIIRKQKPAIKRDKNGEAYFTYKIEGQTRIGYFHDRKGYEEKIKRIRDKHPEIGGIAHWYIGPEDPEIWKFLRSPHFKEK